MGSTLRDKLKDSTIGEGRHGFLPEGKLIDLLPDEVVKSELKRCRMLKGCPILKDPELGKLVRFILQKARKTFAVLTLNGSLELIDLLRSADHVDSKFPFEKEKLRAAIRDGLGKSPYKEDLWDGILLEDLDADIDNMISWQHRLAAPIFNPDVFKYKLDADTPLPFRDLGSNSVGGSKGGFGEVHEELLHHDHLQIVHDPKLNHSVDDVDNWRDLLEKDLLHTEIEGTRYVRVAMKQLMKVDNWTAKELNDSADNEAENLMRMNRYNHRHFIKGISYFNQAGNHFLLFPWTEEGNLEQVWSKANHADASIQRWAVEQMAKLASGIHTLHNENYRHGDLKPQNILCFRDDRSETGLRLVIADVGLAKVHQEITEFRKGATKTKAASVTYAPPEFELNARRDEPASRLYDIWSIGCVFLEFALWMACGWRELQSFRDELRGTGLSKPPIPFWVGEPADDLHSVVKELIGFLLNGLENGSPLYRVVNVIANHLLVIKVPPQKKALRKPILDDTLVSSTPISPAVQLMEGTFNLEVTTDDGPTRAEAEQFDILMSAIAASLDPNTYKVQLIRDNLPTPRFYSSGPSLLSVADARRPSTGGGSRNMRKARDDYMATGFDDIWDYTPDEGLAREVFQNIDPQTILPVGPNTPLCNRCSDLNLLLATSKFTDTITMLETRSKTPCGLCEILFSWCSKHRDAIGSESVEFYRHGTRLVARRYGRDEGTNMDTGPNEGVAMLCQAPSDFTSRNLQLGFPKLPSSASPTHIAIISRWLTQCDDRHDCFPRATNFLPTRLIDVGPVGSLTVRLVCDTGKLAAGTRYLALSHRWGDTHQKTLKTQQKHVKGQTEWIIPLEDLPKTFLDAVKTTRSLGHRFLWIDSLCIIQDSKEDWSFESQRMELVFSSAYCVLAATYAAGTDDGFMKPRTERQAVLMRNPGSGVSFYVCEDIDDFAEHVEASDLNSRGWVLQERALARRTIHFTGTQTYWECKEGIRCETFTKMKNDKSSVLGDSNFPIKALEKSQGKRIKTIQLVYEHYSNKSLSYYRDRPVAIKGLEARLIQTLGGPGGYGVFRDKLHRWLLWQRDTKQAPLERIAEFSGGPVPSWSWMAWKGGIKYLSEDIQGSAVDWRGDVVWRVLPGEKKAGGDSDSLFLRAPVWDFASISAEVVKGLIFDEGLKGILPGMKCVVLGVGKWGGDRADCYVLVVKKSEVSCGGELFWERVGVGKLAKRDVAMGKEGLTEAELIW